MEPISLWGLTVYPYGLAVAVSAVLALWWSSLRCKKAGIGSGTLSWFALLAVPLGLLCARLGYVLSEFEYYLSDGFAFFWQGFIDFPSGGYMLYGALAGCLLAVLITGKLRKVSFGKLADALAAPAALMIAMCRLAEGLAGVGYGWGLEDWFVEGEGYSVFTLESPEVFCRFPFAVADYYGEWKWAVFALMALLMIVVTVILTKADVRREGGRCSLFLLMYAALQILGESLRQDAILKWGFVRVNQVIGAILVMLILILCWRKSNGSVLQLVRSAVLALLCVLVVAAMEFAMEGKISAIEWMPMDVCYLLTACACVGMILSVLTVWRRAFGQKVSV